MKNCLVTKLKSSVDNNNLPIFDQLKFKVGHTGEALRFYMKAYASDNCVVTGIPDAGGAVSFSYISDESQTYTNPFTIADQMNGFIAVASGADCTITILNKSKLRLLSNGSFGVNGIIEGAKDILAAIPEEVKILRFERSISTEITLEDIISSCPTFEALYIAKSYYMQGNIAALTQLSSFKNLDAGECRGLTGDITSLGSMTTLENLALYATNVSGTMESFVAAQRASGRTTGTITGSGGNWGQVTFNGSRDNAKGAVSWTETTITMNGITIDA